MESRGVEFILPKGGAWLSLSPPADADIYLARFADGAAVPLKQPAGGRAWSSASLPIGRAFRGGS